MPSLAPTTTTEPQPRRPAAAGPVVFLSYARPDRALADRLLADLERAGHSCWLDTSDIPGGEDWIAAIADGLGRAYAVLTLVTEAANRSDWVRREFLYAERLGKPVIPLMAGDCPLPWYMIDRQAIPLDPDYLRGLLAALPKPATTPTRTDGPRQAELAYLRRLLLGELVHTELYTPMAGVAKRGRPSAPLPAVVMRPEFQHLRRLAAHGAEPKQESRDYDDIVTAFGEARRAALLGEPGAGKTTTLWKLARDAAERALADPAAPLPLLVRLGQWTEPHEPIQRFIERELGELGMHLNALLASRRAVPLLDGLNEVPAGERAAKAALVKAWLAGQPALPALVSCRELDYTGALDLGLDTVTIKPLDPRRILAFATGYLGAAADEADPARRAEQGRALGEDLFWRLAGGDAVREVWRVWQAAGADWALFWAAQDVPRADPDVYHKTSGAQDALWRQAAHDPRSLLRLAGNPYLLFMLTQIYLGAGGLPANRARLFDGFVQVLLLREGLAEDAEGEWRATEEGGALLAGLERLAWAMQTRRAAAADGDSEAGTVLPRTEAAQWLGERLLPRAAAASLLDVGGRDLRFSHQLLQEYFTARGLRSRLERGDLAAEELWPRCWERGGWEEAAVLLTGFHADDCTKVVDWLAQAHPETAAQCVLDSGAHTPEATLRRLRQAWLPRLADLEHDPEPEARAAVGRALGRLRLDGQPLDDRPGVALRFDARLGRPVPDIDWVQVPAGEFLYQDGERLALPGFFIARYPVTHAQFQCFVDDPEGYGNPAWWQGLARRYEQPGEPRWDYSNHPRETVSWYEAVAFCRWLTGLLGYEVRLPSEQEWEKAARGADGRAFPWGPFQPGHANIDETIGNAGPHNLGKTSAAGIYPQGRSPYGALDMAGNVWEWCLNEYERPQRTGTAGDALRVVRGGSWDSYRDFARAAYRHNAPYRHYGLGFRLLCVAPIP